MSSSKLRPRVYLDTAVLLDISDGKVPAEQVAGLHAALREQDGDLVISGGHLIDVVRGTDDGTRARVCRAIDEFPSRAFVQVHPLEAELEAANAGPLD